MEKPRSAVLIIRDGRVLLIKRKAGTTHTYYVLPGGGIEAGETPTDAAVRELHEELRAQIEVKRIQLDPLQTDRQTWIVHANLKALAVLRWQEQHKQKRSNTYEVVWIPLRQAQELEIYPKSTVSILKGI